jgi:hypothetical protein
MKWFGKKFFSQTLCFLAMFNPAVVHAMDFEALYPSIIHFMRSSGIPELDMLYVMSEFPSEFTPQHAEEAMHVHKLFSIVRDALTPAVPRTVLPASTQTRQTFMHIAPWKRPRVCRRWTALPQDCWGVVASFLSTPQDASGSVSLACVSPHIELPKFVMSVPYAHMLRRCHDELPRACRSWHPCVQVCLLKYADMPCLIAPFKAQIEVCVSNDTLAWKTLSSMPVPPWTDVIYVEHPTLHVITAEEHEASHVIMRDLCAQQKKSHRLHRRYHKEHHHANWQRMHSKQAVRRKVCVRRK